MTKWSLKDLFGLTAFFAVVAWTVASVGVINPMFWFGTFVSLMMSQPIPWRPQFVGALIGWN